MLHRNSCMTIGFYESGLGDYQGPRRVFGVEQNHSNCKLSEMEFSKNKIFKPSKPLHRLGQKSFRTVTIIDDLK